MTILLNIDLTQNIWDLNSKSNPNSPIWEWHFTLLPWLFHRSSCYASSRTFGSSETLDPSIWIANNKSLKQKLHLKKRVWNAIHRKIYKRRSIEKEKKRRIPLWWKCGGASLAFWCHSCGPCRTGCERCGSST